MRTEIDHPTVEFVAVAALNSTEPTAPAAVERQRRTLLRRGVWTDPILVERATLTVLDGHGRFRAAEALGLKVVPSVLTDGGAGRRASSRGVGDAADEMRALAREALSAAGAGDGAVLSVDPRSDRRAWTPRVAVAIEALKDASLERRAAAVRPLPGRLGEVQDLLFDFGRRLETLRVEPTELGLGAPEQTAPHPLLRRLLTADPAMAALLPGARCCFTLSESVEAPFDGIEQDLIALGPHLLDDRRALAVAARWALEIRSAAMWAQTSAQTSAHISAHSGAQSGAHQPDPMRLAARLADAFRHGVSLAAGLSAEGRDLLLAGAPLALSQEIDAAAADPAGHAPSDLALRWTAGRLAPELRPAAGARLEREHPRAGVLALSTEALLASGGDSRLAIDPRTGLNRYGTAPRPRPEAAQFSSSTASSVSDCGFLLCDQLRRAFHAAAAEAGAESVHPIAVDALWDAFRALCGAEGKRSFDLAVAPSGTDLELLTVALALAAPGRRRGLTNILIAPEETGRGVAHAAAGRFFDGEAATGAPVAKGAPAWPEADIAIEAVAIREADGTPRAVAAMDAEIERLTRAAIAAGRRVLIHTLPSSKTGLSGPSDEAVARLRAWRRDRIDVAVDACQFRAAPKTLAAWAARGWIVQTTGSKFLTGPPFSGALLLPPALRKRADRLGALLAAAPGVGAPGDWCAPWRAAFQDATPPARGAAPANFGAVFRWLPALLEARMFDRLSDGFKARAYEAFSSAVRRKLSESRHLRVIAAPGGAEDADAARFDWNGTIVCFTVSAQTRTGFRPLDAEESVRAFKLLNRDVSGMVGHVDPAERAILRRPAHIGQPVTVASESARPLTFLRMVLGARFFNETGFAEPGAVEAALRSEIADAARALDKLDRIAAHWPRLAHLGGEGL
ncbi:MAG: hypothetical protein AAFW46_14465 [Pseudomonadota bacterium]